MLNNLRLRYGLFWRYRFPVPSDYDLRPLLAVLMLALCVAAPLQAAQLTFAAVDADYWKMRYEQRTAELLSCWNGTGRWSDDEGAEVACMKAVYNLRRG